MIAGREVAVDDYPRMIAPVNHIEPVPRRARAVLGGATVLDSTLDGERLSRPQTHLFKIGH